jgi:Amt family ammonium transporter
LWSPSGWPAAQTPPPAPAATPAPATGKPAEAAPGGAGRRDASAASKIDKGDTAWLLMSTALVLLMTAPGLALFYGGMVRQKNALGTLMQSFIVLALISIQWVLWGYSLAFGPDKGGIIGGPRMDGASRCRAGAESRLRGHDPSPGVHALSDDVRRDHTGPDHRRLRGAEEVLHVHRIHLAWATLVYDPLAHWVWGTGGWLRNLGALDFAGGTVVHISSGVSALAAAWSSGNGAATASSRCPRTTCR